MKTVIVYKWNSNSEEALIKTMQRMGIHVVEIDRQMKDYHADAEFASELMTCIHKEKPIAVFSYNYFPLISSVCEVIGLPYLSWIYDCPLYTLNSLTVKNEHNYIFCFDRSYAGRLSERGAKHCFHMPLGVDVQGFSDVVEESPMEEKKKYTCDVSFVGSLYNDDKNRLRKVLSDEKTDKYLSGYLEGIIAAQKNVYGYNFVGQALQEEVVAEIAKKCELKLGKLYEYIERDLSAVTVNMEITAREREEVLLNVAEVCNVDLYTGSKLSENLKGNHNIRCRGYADNKKEMPFIFRESKINLNVTSRSIESGIPLRVLDVLACGGFCITNYQPEVAELLHDGEEIVMYTSMEDLQEKVKYYLEHEEERKRIAESSYRAVRERFLLLKRIQDMFDAIEFRY